MIKYFLTFLFILNKFSPFGVYFKDVSAWQRPLFSLKHQIPSLNSPFDPLDININFTKKQTKKKIQGLLQVLSIFTYLKDKLSKNLRQQISLSCIWCCLICSMLFDFFDNVWFAWCCLICSLLFGSISTSEKLCFLS